MPMHPAPNAATILLVEDESDLARVIQRELEAHGYRVLHAADGLDGVRLHTTHAPDLIVLDWMLPRLNGLDVLRAVRRTAATPVLMLTARGDEADRVVGLEVGADDYLAKPFGMRELVARVRALLRRMEQLQAMVTADQQTGGPPLHYGDLSVDPAGFQATLQGTPLDLSRTEFHLLYLLLRNPGRAFSRTYLLDTVWGASYSSGDRAVDNAILRLRKKLGPLGETIETVWGVGYRLKAVP
jgi:DNA-binding response OmpR family regulator